VFTTENATSNNAMEFVSNDASLGALAGYNRTYFDNFGMYATQGWMNISGKYVDLGGSNLEIIYPGATKTNTQYYAANRANGGTGSMLGLSNDIAGPCLLMQDNHANVGLFYVATQPTVTAGGTGYVVGDVLTVSGGTSVAATSTSLEGVELGGSGYTNGDVLTVSGGTGTAATFTVTGVSGGVITAATLTTSGTYTELPPNTCPVTGGTGTSAYFNMIWPSKGATKLEVTSVSGGVVTGLRVVRPGWYSATPGNPASTTGGTGSGATVTITWSDRASISRLTESMDQTRTLVFAQWGDGFIQWGYAQDIDLLVGDPANLYWYDIGVMKSDADRWEFEGLKLPVNGVQQIGNQIDVTVTRSCSSTAATTVEIGSIDFNNDGIGGGGGTVHVVLTTASSTGAVTRVYDIVTYYNVTAGAWAIVDPAMTLASNGQDIVLDAMMTNTVLSLRLRTIAATATATAYVSISSVSAETNEFTPSTTTASGVSTPTITFPGFPPVSLDKIVKNIAVPTTGGTVTIPLGTPLQIINPAGTLATLTIALPTGQVDNQRQVITFRQIITALTITPSGSTVQWTNGTATAVNQRLEFVYNAADFVWYRIQ
jgi:hypothetical protein